MSLFVLIAFAAAVGFIVFGHVPSQTSFIGMGLVIVAGVAAAMLALRKSV